jgi:hypothetical protein
MLKPKFTNILLFIVVKYVIFYIFMMLKNDDYTLIDFKQIETIGNLQYYILIFFPLPIIMSLVFTAPLYYSFKLSKLYFLLILFSFIVLEYLIYTKLASEADLSNGIYNGLISLTTLLLFFYRPISAKLRELKIRFG